MEELEYLEEYLDETDNEILSMEEWETWVITDDNYVHIPGTDIYVSVEDCMDLDEAISSVVYIAYLEKKKSQNSP